MQLNQSNNGDGKEDRSQAVNILIEEIARAIFDELECRVESRLGTLKEELTKGLDNTAIKEIDSRLTNLRAEVYGRLVGLPQSQKRTTSCVSTVIYDPTTGRPAQFIRDYGTHKSIGRVEYDRDTGRPARVVEEVSE